MCLMKLLIFYLFIYFTCISKDAGSSDSFQHCVEEDYLSGISQYQNHDGGTLYDLTM